MDNNLKPSYINAMKELYGLKPDTVKNIDNLSYFFYRNELYLKIQSLFEFKNTPDSWDIDYLRDNLYQYGYLCCVEKDGTNYLLQGGITGINVYNKPTEVQIANPVIGTFSVNIGEKAELLYFNRINGFYRSADELVSKYAIMLANCDCTINTNLINSRVAHVFTANSEAERQTYQKMYDDVSSGKPAVFLLKKKNLDIDSSKNMTFLDVKNSYIANDVLDTKRTIMNEFLTEIGINNANSDKRERLVSSEVQANNGEVMSIASLWLDTLRECLDRINKTFNLNVSVNYNSNVITNEIRSDDNELDQSDSI